MFKVIKETEEFEKSLKELEFLQGDSTDLLKYARDVNCHFASKKCKDVIVAARKLMTSKMHNTVKVCVSVFIREVSGYSNQTLQENLWKYDYLSASFCFFWSSSLRSHQTTSCVFPSCPLQVQRWKWSKRPQMRRWQLKTQSSYQHGVYVCRRVASVSQCSSWWSWHSTRCLKLLEAPHIGTFQCTIT